MRSIRKTIAALLLLAVLAGSLTACASGENSEPTVGAGEEADPAESGILVAYLPEESGAVAQAAAICSGEISAGQISRAPPFWAAWYLAT